MTHEPPAHRAEWYFDVVSPFAYLQLVAHLPRLRESIDIVPKPIVLGAVLGHWGQKGPAEIEPKRLHTYRLAQHRAGELGIPLRFPPAHPFNPIAATRAIVAMMGREPGGGWPAVEAVYALIWRDGLDLSEPAALAAMAQALEAPDLAELIAADDVKAALRANGEAALAAGVFGVPSLVADGHVFWGEDATAMFEAYVADPGLFAAPEMARLATLRVGIARK